VDLVEVAAEVQNVGIIVGGSVGLSKSSSVGIHLLQVGLVVNSGHGISERNEGSRGSLEFECVEFVGGNSGNQSVVSNDTVDVIIEISDLPWGASNGVINSSDESVVGWVNLEHNVGNSEGLEVLRVVLGSSSVGIDEISSDDVISRVHVYKREISGGWAGFSIKSNSKNWGNQSIAGNGGLDESKEGNSVAISVLAEGRWLSIENNSVDARTGLQRSSSVIKEGKSVGVGSEPKSNS